MFCLFYEAKAKKIHALNGSGRYPQNGTLEKVRRDLKIPSGGEGSIPMTSVLAVTVPGAAAGWVDTVEKFGSGKLSLEQILKSAVELAEEGFPVSELSSYYVSSICLAHRFPGSFHIPAILEVLQLTSLKWKQSEQTIRNASPNFREMLKKDPKATDGVRSPAAGEIMKNPTMARTFRTLAAEGKKGFYEGRVAEEIVKVVRELGGYMTLDDLKFHAETGSQETEAISLQFRGQNIGEKQSKGDHKTEGVEVWEHPPNGQGIVALMALGILEELEKTGKIPQFSQEQHNSAEYLHAVIESLRIAFADANWWVTDPDVEKVPTKELISRSYLAERAKLFNPNKASGIPDHGSPAHNHSDTVYFAVTDKDGNGMSFINSNYGGFGTCIIPKDCGFTLQNRGANFSLQAGHPNVLVPGKRPYHTIIPAMITNLDGSLHSVYGVMGGFMQPQGHVQVLLNMLAFNFNPQAAIDSPRVCIGAGMPENGDVSSLAVYLEDGINEEAAEGLRKLGHNVKTLTGYARGMFGRGQLIRCHYDNGQLVYSAGSDPRGDGMAVPV